MSDRKIFILQPSPHPARRNAMEAVQAAPEGYEVQIKPPTRNSVQNARMWAMLGDVSRQVVWHGKRLTSEDWKHVFSSSLRRLEVVPNLDSTGFVALGMSTSQMSKREMVDMIDLIYSFGAERDVHWSDPVQHERQAA